MVKQLILPFIGVAIFITAVGLFIKNSGSINISTLPTPSATTAPGAKTVKIGSKSINVEIANTQVLRAKGLSGRSSLDANSGMLFVFDTKNVTAEFWMKDMLIPLDMIWIDNGKVMKIDKNIKAPAAGTPDNMLKVYTPDGTIDYVLEVNAGFSDKNKVKVGDSVTLPTL